MKKDRLEHLDGIRGIAAFSVMMGHVAWPSAISDFIIFTSTTLWVDFFFVLSGFIMARVYLERIAAGLPVLDFMMRRVARLYPLHLLTLLAALAYEVAKWLVFDNVAIDAKNAPFANNDLFSFICTLLFVHALGVLPQAYWNGPSWSISVDFYVCLLFAVGLAATRRRRALFWVLLSCVLILSVSMLAIFCPGKSVQAGYGVFRGLLGFGLGIIVERLCSRVEIPTFSSRNWLNLIAAGLVVVLLCIKVKGTLLMNLAPFIFAGVIWLLVRFRGGPVEGFLRSRPVQNLAALSYSIIMTHGLVLGVLTSAWQLLGHKAFFHTGWGEVLLREGLTVTLIVIVLPLSWFCYQRVEMPAQRWLNALADRPRRPAKSSDAAAVLPASRA